MAIGLIHLSETNRVLQNIYYERFSEVEGCYSTTDEIESKLDKLIQDLPLIKEKIKKLKYLY